MPGGHPEGGELRYTPGLLLLLRILPTRVKRRIKINIRAQRCGSGQNVRVGFSDLRSVPVGGCCDHLPVAVTDQEREDGQSRSSRVSEDRDARVGPQGP